MYEEQAKMQTGTLGSPAACGDSSLAVPMDKREIARALDDLRNVVERYGCLVASLSDKLSCVVSPAPPECIEKEKQGYQTGLANAINGTCCKLRNITDCLESLYGRIEL
jgi:hypothetical protein